MNEATSVCLQVEDIEVAVADGRAWVRGGSIIFPSDVCRVVRSGARCVSACAVSV